MDIQTLVQGSRRPSREGDTVVRVQHLRKTYGDVVAVADVSFEVQRGEIFGILGPNGAGKTTTVETLAGLRVSDGGSVEVLGVDPQRQPETIRQDVGIQLQEASLPAKITVSEALRLFASFYPDPGDPDELLRRLRLADKKDSRFDDLSGGQKQRLSIAMALVGRPQIAILDELTTGLDPQARRDTWQLIEEVRDSGVTILLVTHFMDEAERLCDRLVVIDKGAVIAEGSPAELTGATNAERSFRIRLPEGSAITAAQIETIPEVNQVRSIGGELEISGAATALTVVILALAERDIVPDGVRTLSRSLEDVFVDLVSDASEGANS